METFMEILTVSHISPYKSIRLFQVFPKKTILPTDFLFNEGSLNHPSIFRTSHAIKFIRTVIKSQIKICQNKINQHQAKGFKNKVSFVNSYLTRDLSQMI